MNTVIRTSTNSKTGYELVEGDKIIPIDTTYKGEPKTLVLPTNASNRKYFNSDKVDKAPGQSIELTLKETKILGARTTATETKSISKWQDFMTEVDKVIYEDIKLRAEAAKLAAKPELTELQKAEAAYKRAMEKLEALKLKNIIETTAAEVEADEDIDTDEDIDSTELGELEEVNN